MASGKYKLGRLTPVQYNIIIIYNDTFLPHFNAYLHSDDDRELYPAHLRELVSRHIYINIMLTFQKTTKSVHFNKICGIYVYTAAHYCILYF